MSRNPIFWLRISYLAGASLDGIAGLIMLVPPLFALNNRLTSFSASADFRYAMGMGAPLMLAWTVLLLWADRRPVERRGVLPITVLVILGEVVNEILGVRAGYVLVTALIPTFFIQTLLTLLMAFSYWKSRQMETV